MAICEANSYASTRTGPYISPATSAVNPTTIPPLTGFPARSCQYYSIEGRRGARDPGAARARGQGHDTALILRLGTSSPGGINDGSSGGVLPDFLRPSLLELDIMVERSIYSSGPGTELKCCAGES